MQTKTWINGIAALLLAAALATGARSQEPGSYSSLVRPQDRRVAAQWFTSHFAGSGPPPFSFEYDGKPSAAFLTTWTRRHTTARLDARRTRDEYVYADPKTRLTVRCSAVRYSDFPAVEWTAYFQNMGTADTPIIANVQALDLALSPARAGDYALHYSEGSHAAASDYQPLEAALKPGSDLALGGASGWSTTEVLSYLCFPGADPLAAQCHTFGLSYWLPLSGTAAHKEEGSTYDFRCALTAALSFGSALTEWGRQMMADYRRARPLFSGDFYLLTAYSTGRDVWCVTQLHRADLGEGLVPAFRREDCPYTQGAFALSGLAPEAEYVLEDRDTGETWTVPGRSLAGEGLSVSIGGARQSQLVFYRRI